MGTDVKVYKSVNAVAFELAKLGIRKGGENKFQHYQFRSIDDVLSVMSPLLASNNLIIYPEKIERTTDKYQKGGKDGLSVFVELSITYVIKSTLDGSSFNVNIVSEGQDTGDKATNKALSAGYKYMIFQTFCPPVEGAVDADRFSSLPSDQAPEIVPEPEPVLPLELEARARECAENGMETYSNFFASLSVEEKRLLSKSALHAELKIVAQNADLDKEAE